MPIYTRTGDDGTTALFGGKRVLKCEELVDVYGSIDELNSWIGLITAKGKKKKENGLLTAIQADLFTIGSTLAGWKGDLTELAGRVGEMEKQIDVWEKQLPKLTNFILPGGSTDAARVHIARSICRRVERQVVALSQNQSINSSIIKYFNRLSDLLFTLARTINKDANVPEIIWRSRKKA
ncbi:cob(I)yrinic acid a,c-diamide adenosyltransferase [Candidatus Gottesmanbacteria bacterium]|nr:cob(I)yrinic acid a,c-diamide adenosyltransferase [Candidatus Gottesmanbacteria bacterium]